MKPDITVGLVCEGPRDQELLEGVIDSLFPAVHFTFRYLQPETSLLSVNYNGWVGVLRWCYKDAGKVISGNKALADDLDLIVVQIDGDVARTEKKVHCDCSDTGCDRKEELRKAGRILNPSGRTCSVECAEKDCPVELPCGEHPGEKPAIYAEHMNRMIRDYLGETNGFPFIITVPCDNTDAWIVAAFDDSETPELIEKPWESVISVKKEYHGIRRSRNKSKNIMRQFLPVIVDNWQKVIQKCPQAAKLDSDLRGIIDGI